MTKKKKKLNWNKLLTFPVNLEGVVALPGSTTWTTNGLGKCMSFSKTSWWFSSWCETTHFSVLVDRVAEPLNFGISPDSLVEWINQNDLIILVRGVLSYPVRVQYSQGTTLTTNTLLKSNDFFITQSTIINLNIHSFFFIPQVFHTFLSKFKQVI